MSHAISIRMGEAEAMHVKVQAMKQGKTQTEIVREAIWRDAAVAEIRDQTRAAVESEFDLLFAKIAADYSVELQTQLVEMKTELQTQLTEMRDENKNHLQKMMVGLSDQTKKTGEILFNHISGIKK